MIDMKVTKYIMKIILFVVYVKMLLLSALTVKLHVLCLILLWFYKKKYVTSGL